MILKIEQLRKAAGLSQQELASILSVNQTAVSQWEKNRSSPTVDKLPALANALHCSIDDLFEKEVEADGKTTENQS